MKLYLLTGIISLEIFAVRLVVDVNPIYPIIKYIITSWAASSQEISFFNVNVRHGLLTG